MNTTRTALPGVFWTSPLATSLADAAAAVAALDARVSRSSHAAAWHLRASWTGHAQAMRLQLRPFEEIDIIAAACGIQLPGRIVDSTTHDPLHGLAAWQADLLDRRRWEIGDASLPSSTSWAGVPRLVRALTVLDAQARADPSPRPWLALPLTLAHLGVTRRPLPCLVVGDPGQRHTREPAEVVLMRLLKQVRRAATADLERLDRLEDLARRNAAAVAAEHRPGKLLDLTRISLGRPCLAARTLAPLVGLSISGAGKLLERATRLGILAEVSGRETWRTYLTPDVAIALGMVAAPRGRPSSIQASAPAMSEALAAFDDELAAIDAQLARLSH